MTPEWRDRLGQLFATSRQLALLYAVDERVIQVAAGGKAAVVEFTQQVSTVDAQGTFRTDGPNKYRAHLRKREGLGQWEIEALQEQAG
jgi:hypothetical protein